MSHKKAVEKWPETRAPARNGRVVFEVMESWARLEESPQGVGQGDGAHQPGGTPGAQRAAVHRGADQHRQAGGGGHPARRRQLAPGCGGVGGAACTASPENHLPLAGASPRSPNTGSCRGCRGSAACGRAVARPARGAGGLAPALRSESPLSRRERGVGVRAPHSQGWADPAGSTPASPPAPPPDRAGTGAGGALPGLPAAGGDDRPLAGGEVPVVVVEEAPQAGALGRTERRSRSCARARRRGAYARRPPRGRPAPGRRTREGRSVSHHYLVEELLGEPAVEVAQGGDPGARSRTGP